MQKGFSSIFLVVGLLIIALIGGAIYLGKVGISKPITKAPTQTTQSPLIEKSELKTYTNNQASYSIKYPSFLTQSASSYDGVGGKVAVDSWSPADNSYSIWVYSYKEGTQPKLEFNAKTETDESILIADQKVRKIRSTEIVSEKGTLIHVGPLKNKDQNYMFVYSSGNLKADPKDIDIFDQMLATFQSLSTSGTTNLKTYTSSKYRFSFAYPSNLTVRQDSNDDFIGFLEGPNENQSQKLVVFVTENPKNLNIREFLEKNKPIPDDRINLNYQETTINGYDALILRYENPCLGICEKAKTGKYFTKYIKGNGVIVSLAVETQNQAGNTPDDEKWLDQVLSTFKFN